MEPLGKYVRLHVIIRRSMFLWMLLILVCTVFILYRADENTLTPTTRANTDDNFHSVLNLEDDIDRRLNYKNEQNLVEYEKYVQTTENQPTPSADTLNNTNKAVRDILFFNRVPKVGSQTFMELLKYLSARNQFRFHRDAVQRVEMIRLSVPQQHELVTAISDLPEPSAYVKHVCFTNFTRYGRPMPIYVNLVRDPVERVISWFYYVRAPWYFVERKKAFPDLPLPDSEWLRKDFETCVLTGDPECVYHQGAQREGIGDHRRQTLFFCGHEPDCTPFNSQEALDNAKYAVESEYAVVGVLEDLNATLTVLENYVPRFFRGASEIYHASNINRINKNAFKPPVSEYVKNIVRKNFTREIEFYEFCKQRLYAQLKALNLPSRN